MIPQIVLIDDVREIRHIRVYGSLKEAEEYVGNGMVVKEQGKEIYYVLPKSNETYQVNGSWEEE